MLSSADRGLVEQDSALPGLPVLLDVTALGEWLSDRTGVPTRVEAPYLRYKPGTSCVLAFEMVTPDGRRHCLARDYAAAGQPKMAKSLRRAPRGAVIALDLDLRLLVTAAEADRDLPGVREILRGGARRPDLWSRWPAEVVQALSDGVSPVRYNPERRWIAVAGGHTPRAVIRAVRPTATDTVASGYRALSRGPVRSPRLLAVDRRRGLVVVEWVAGTSVADLDASGRQRAEAVRGAGAALATLHTDGRPGAGEHVDGEPVRACRAAGHQLGLLLPDLATAVDGVVAEITGRLAELTRRRRLIHGDFSDDQVVLQPDGRVALIDLDAVRAGDPAEDTASLVGSLVRGGAEHLVEAAQDGYASVAPLPRPDVLRVHTAAHLLRRAVEPFRRREPAWEDHARRLVARAAAEIGCVVEVTR